MIAKRGYDATRDLLESWMANDPQIIPSDGELLGAINSGVCDVGLTNHYYLGRALLDDPDIPIAPAWPDQDGAGAHTNVSGVGMVTSTDQPDEATALIEFLTSAEAAELVTSGSEFAANPEAPPPAHIADWATVKMDLISATETGPLIDDAVELMLDVGWR
jgi:iron(III) transport system substrate-binding protein